MNGAAADQLAHHFKEKLHCVSVHKIQREQVVRNIPPFLSRAGVGPDPALAYLNERTPPLH
tara:strand:- start:4 stop:186 length:183 start_codon:yes stop_codon:yes gene_type:complete